MEEKLQVKTSLGSKLPKYGAKSIGSTLQSVPNGTAVNTLGNSMSSSGKNFVKHNGSINMSSYSFNWRKSNKYQLNDQSPRDFHSTHNSCGKLVDPEKHVNAQETFGKSGLKRDLKSVSLLTSKIAKPSNMFVSSSEELNQKTLCGLSSSSKFTKASLLGRTSYSSLSAPKSQLNGFYGNRSTISMQRPRANSCTTRNSSGESLAQSPDNVKSFTCEKIVRSQSFSHSIQKSFLPLSSITRSHSFNRAADLARPYQNQQLPIRVPPRSSMQSKNVRSEVLNRNEHLAFGFNRPYAAFSGSGLKKSALPNGSGVTSFDYRLGRTSLLSPNRPQFTGKIIVDDNKNSAADKCVLEDSSVLGNDGAIEKEEDLIENYSSRTESSRGINDNMLEDDAKVRYLSDDVDEISLSSLSSSDKNDLSEDFSDDFVDIEDSNRTRVTPEEVSLKEENLGSVPLVDPFDSLKESEKPFSKTDEWIDIRVPVEDKNECTKRTTGNDLISPDMDYRAGSSFELSPSDSSDGTYMWDEEGLEPIGSVRPCGSYESSEMNSIDILNNLDSCDLEDDDLMLDVDLPEDAPLKNVECENMNRFDGSDRNVRQHQEGFWKRPPQRWSGQEHYRLSHSDSCHQHGKTDLSRGSPYRESPLSHFESYRGSSLYQGPRMLVDVPEHAVMLDEMTLWHMVQDCTAVKTQLLKLKRLLHQNDGNGSQDIQLSLPSSPEPEPEVGDQIYKNEDLLNDIKLLKEELKKKDEKIQQLEQQLATRCKCHQNSKGEKCTYADKYTQTSWRRISPQVLQPSSNLPRPTDHAQGKLIKPQHIEAHSESPVVGLREDVERLNENFADDFQQKSDYGLTELPQSLKSPLIMKELAMNIPSEEYLSMRRNVSKPNQLTSNKTSELESAPFFQVSTGEDQAQKAVKNQPWPIAGMTHPKALQLQKPSVENSSVPYPGTISESSHDRPTACKTSELTTCNSAKLPTTSQTSLISKPNQKASKLRPPSVSSLKQKQIMSSPKQEPQNFQGKTNIPRPLTQRREIMQHQTANFHSGDCLTSKRYSRLPKPKIH
ncbi:serine-rich coiled-coil domain-containing protein 2 isoform X1 [Vombatus ursinus]|uniref:Coiled-coil serine rich protein 2 n=2 Tax=Vombatus ursinus TaxID=29139 RepID=A0A4X2L9Q2_VOMUR|nr:serine-rich coiled-coil domain-containing protein 2 isoform X1 [Vombatus ursinus]XP_027702099.1 serine-rich coiled-coil domain-containing protein 2 isoform X1 [Vombatus ursinus]